jgi:hypothetical protein
MRRLAIKLVLFLLLGAIVNVAVAWGCVLGFEPYFNHHVPVGNERVLSARECEVVLRRAFPDTPINAEETYGNTQSRFGWTSAWASSPRGDAEIFWLDVDETIAGWPMYAFRGQWEEWLGWGPVDQESRYVGAIAVPEWAKPEKGNRRLIEFVPIRPIWPGFAINTIFYAAVLWVVFAIPGGVKRLRRRRRGQCIHCGYDLRGQPPESDKCPECGKRVPS